MPERCYAPANRGHVTPGEFCLRLRCSVGTVFGRAIDVGRQWSGGAVHHGVRRAGSDNGQQPNHGREDVFLTYGYNAAGSLTGETYPSGRVVKTGYDGAHRPAWVQGSFGGVNTDYPGSPGDPNTWAHHWPHGGLYYHLRGNGVWRTEAAAEAKTEAQVASSASAAQAEQFDSQNGVKPQNAGSIRAGMRLRVPV